MAEYQIKWRLEVLSDVFQKFRIYSADARMTGLGFFPCRQVHLPQVECIPFLQQVSGVTGGGCGLDLWNTFQGSALADLKMIPTREPASAVGVMSTQPEMPPSLYSLSRNAVPR